MRQRGARGQMLGEIALIDQARGFALRQDELGFRRALARAHRHHDDAGARRRQHRDDELETIAEQQREAIAFAEAALRQVAGDRFDLLVERLVGDALAAEHQRVALRMARRDGAKHRVDMRRPLRKAAHDAVAVMRLVAQRDHQRDTRVGRPSRKPPSTVSNCPVMSAASAASHTMVCATSSAVQVFCSAAASAQPSRTRA